MKLPVKNYWPLVYSLMLAGSAGDVYHEYAIQMILKIVAKHICMCYNMSMKTIEKKESKNLREYRDVTDFPPEKYLQVNNCGMKNYFQWDYTIFRSKGRKDYYILYAALGWFDIEYGGEMSRIDKGTCIVILPETPQLISFTAAGAPTVFYIHFTGTAVSEIIDPLELEPITRFKIQDCTRFEILFKRLVKNFLPLKAVNGRKTICTSKVNGMLLELLDCLARSKAGRAKLDQDGITTALLYINEHFREEVNLEKYAEIAHLSLGRFSHVFTKKVGIPPHKYVQALRMEEAKELLRFSSMSIREVAASIGIDEPSYFSRIFRKYTGFSPTDYRNRKNDFVEIAQT